MNFFTFIIIVAVVAPIATMYFFPEEEETQELQAPLIVEHADIPPIQTTQEIYHEIAEPEDYVGETEIVLNEFQSEMKRQCIEMGLTNC
jgi:hypothetical protein